MISWYDATNHARDLNKLRQRSERLDLALSGDFTWLQDELAKQFDDTSHLTAHPYNIPRRVADMFARHYRLQPVQRLFTADQRVDFAKLKEVYQRSGIDAAMLQVHRHLVIQQSQYVLVVPDSVRKVRLLRFSPWQVQIEPGNPLFADDIAHAREVRLLVEVARVSTGYQELSHYGEIVITQSEAWIEGMDPHSKNGSVKRSSLYHPETNDSDAPDFSHPWAADGRCPVWVIRSEEPHLGTSIPPVDEPLYHITTAFGIRVGDLAHVLHFQGHGQAVIEHQTPGGTADNNEIRLGADKVLHVNEGTFKIASPQAMVGEYTAFLEALLRWYALTSGIDQDQFMKAATARTAVSRRFDRLDRAEKRHDFAQLFHAFENVIARAIVRVLNMSEAPALPEDVRVQVTFRDPPEPADPQAEVQARTMGYDAGELSRADYLAERDNMPRDRALEKVARNIAEQRLLQQLDSMSADELMQLADIRGRLRRAVRQAQPDPAPEEIDE